MTLQGFSFKTKILGSFSLLIFLFSLITVFLLHNQSQLGSLQDDGAKLFKNSEVLGRTLLHVSEVYAVVADSEINHDLKQTKIDLANVKKTMDEDIKAIDRIASKDNEKKLAEEFKANYLKYVGTFENEMLPELEKTDVLTSQIRELDGKVDGLRDETLKPLKSFSELMEKESEDSDTLYDATYKNGIKFSIIFSVIITVASLLFSLMMTNAISKVLQSVKQDLISAFELIESNGSKVAKAAEHLSESTNEQASAIQETSSSMEEMNSMIKKTADSASESMKLSKASTDNTNKGKETSEVLIKSVDDIDHSNKMILNEIQKSNERISEIVGLINEISTKTKVINDIVFQTKLLSFNASVEAARAGEQGKGFAVVAEEVGNLAAMSGKAATEISAMLEASTQRVKTVIGETQQGIEGIMLKGDESVKKGISIAKETANILSIIGGDVKLVDANIIEISVASDEQSRGAGQVAQALHQLNQSTQVNSTLSQELFSYSKELLGQTDNLKISVNELEDVIEGKRAA